MWGRERIAATTIMIAGNNSHGLARWLTPTGKRLCDFVPGDVWVIPAGMETTCEFNEPGDIMMIMVEPRHLPKTRASHATLLSENTSVVPLDNYFAAEPVLHDMHYILRQQCHGLPYAQGAGQTIDHFDCAKIFARRVWFLHYVGLRVSLDNVTSARVIQELQDS
ncbi:MAG TPA: hypothetical protein VEB66_01550 [Opitutaceae bacterium]|nr:hypothetical protein [Opitutaceae bacterium]